MVEKFVARSSLVAVDTLVLAKKNKKFRTSRGLWLVFSLSVCVCGIVCHGQSYW